MAKYLLLQFCDFGFLNEKLRRLFELSWVHGTDYLVSNFPVLHFSKSAFLLDRWISILFNTIFYWSNHVDNTWIWWLIKETTLVSNYAGQSHVCLRKRIDSKGIFFKKNLMPVLCNSQQNASPKCCKCTPKSWRDNDSYLHIRHLLWKIAFWRTKFLTLFCLIWTLIT